LPPLSLLVCEAVTPARGIFKIWKILMGKYSGQHLSDSCHCQQGEDGSPLTTASKEKTALRSQLPRLALFYTT